MKKLSTLVVLSVLLLLVSCDYSPAEVPATSDYPRKSIEMIAPAGPGSGYDLTIRAVAQCLMDTKMVPVPLPITNKPGGGGVATLEYENADADDILAVFSPPICMINLNGSTELNYRENTTPIARLITEYGLFAVRKDSPYTTIAQVMEALKKDPKAVKIGGISAPGSMDHIQFLKFAHAAGVPNLHLIEYVGFQDGTCAAQLLGGHVDLVSTGISDTIGLVESGDVRALAVTSDKRIGNSLVQEIPTCMEQGIPATFINWRGIFGPKNMSEHAREYWEKTLRQMAETPEWEETCNKFGWDMEYAGHKDFLTFLDEVNIEYLALLQEIDITLRRPRIQATRTSGQKRKNKK